MMVRDPIVSGRFYPGGSRQCAREVEECMPSESDIESLPARLFGGIVPHAGWTYSGPTAAKVFAALAQRQTPETVILLGADHAHLAHTAAMFSSGAWSSPVGDVAVDERLAERISSMAPMIRDDVHAHDGEHSIEVQIPFVLHVWPDAKILPIIVEPGPRAVEVGQAVARVISTYKTDAVVVGSTDLTHYGASYGFSPKGSGAEALEWAKDVNDRGLIDVILKMDAESVVPEAGRNRSACGSGAIAATVAACRDLGAEQAVLLEHTTSYEIGKRLFAESHAMSVGYAGIVFG